MKPEILEIYINYPAKTYLKSNQFIARFSLSVFEEGYQCVLFAVHFVSKALDRLCFQPSYRFHVVSSDRVNSKCIPSTV